MKGLKVVVEGRGTHTEFQYAMPTPRKNGAWKPGAWMRVEGKLEHCSNDFHFCETPEQVFQSWWQHGAMLYEIETGTEVLEVDNNKRVAREMRLLRPVELPAWLISANEFIDSLKNMVFFAPKAPLALDYPHKLFTAPTLDAAWDAAWDAARDAAWDAAGNTLVNFLCSDLPLDQKHRDYFTAVWSCYQQGYGVVTDVDGVLYVYGIEAQS